MKDKRLETLKELYSLRDKKEITKRVCSICGGDLIDRRTYPSTECDCEYDE